MNGRTQNFQGSENTLYFRECHCNGNCKSFANTGLIHKINGLEIVVNQSLSMLDLAVKYSRISCAGCQNLKPENVGVFISQKLAKTTNQVSSFALLCFVCFTSSRNSLPACHWLETKSESYKNTSNENSYSFCMCMLSHSVVSDFAIPWTVAHPPSLSTRIMEEVFMPLSRGSS